MSCPELHELYHSLSTRYALGREIVKVGEWKVVLYQVENVDDLMEALIARGEDDPAYRDEQIPYWAELWPSAIGLARYLFRKKIISKGQSVLEVGCGLGLPGIVAGKMGGQVILTDYLPEALEMTRLNWLENFGEDPQLGLLDWRIPEASLASDVVLASDVAYETRSFEPLLEAFQVLVKPGGELLISEPNRTLAKPFQEEVRKLGIQITEDLVQVRQKGYLTPVTIFRLRF